MKHLNTYKLFEKWNYKQHELSEMVSNVKDILLDLDDNGFKTNINFFYNPWITIIVTKKTEFEYSEVIDVVERLKEYLVSFGLTTKWKPSIIEKKLMDPSNFSYLGIYFKMELNFSAE